MARILSPIGIGNRKISRSWIAELRERTEGASDDVAVKLHRLHVQLSPMIKEAKKLKSGFVKYTNKQYALECGANKWVNVHSSGLPFDQLLDIKILFECSHLHDGQPGFTESEFIEHFAPIFCQSKDPTQIKIWFVSIDQDANGCIDWDEFSSYLMRTQYNSDREKKVSYITRGVEPESPPPAQSNISNITYNPHLREYYTSSSDGTIRTWDSTNLQDRGIFHYGDGNIVHGLHFLPSSNRLVVGQFDRLVFMYQCGSRTGSATGPRLQRAFKGQTVTAGLWFCPFVLNGVNENHINKTH
eukprot:TRINITY_DN3193_c0_g1_i2.p1 TRINITY_DN3193_c0_g1~~TRINITY_DN3193_c0_g1_i2.p1  ORF type:complete len:300 (+),score=22.90 TRINITY_DN3193_c0_g1_i2:92-991(+)